MRLLRVSLALSAVCLFAFAGCKQEEEIAKETVEHADREPLRLRVAVMEKGELVWFVKFSGPVEQVNAHEKTFDEFVRSFRFVEDDDPTWTEPKGWTKDPKGKDRFVGYRFKAEPKELEIAVTRFPAEKFKMMENMHRWQKQVNVPLTETHEDLDKQVKREKVAGQEVRWVDLQGLGVHTVSKPADPMAANAKNLVPGFPVKKAAGGGAGGAGGGGKVPFKFTVPAGWAKRAQDAFSAEAYTVADKAVVTLTPAGGDLGENLNRWRGQVGLPKATKNELDKLTQELPIAGIKNFYVDFANPKGPPGKNRILGVIIPMDGATWFVKMTGPLDLLGEKKAEFETFVKSFKRTK